MYFQQATDSVNLYDGQYWMIYQTVLINNNVFIKSSTNHHSDVTDVLYMSEENDNTQTSTKKYVTLLEFPFY